MKKKPGKQSIYLLSAVLTASMLAGCGGISNAPGTVSATGSSSMAVAESSTIAGGSGTENALSDSSNAVVSTSVSSSSVESAAEEVGAGNKTDFPDGTYTPDKFSWSGGSGRVEISCSSVEVVGGRSYATIQFSSTHYIYVKADGIKVNGDGTGTFRIPVQLNENNTVIGCTTAMSVPHEIEYSLFISLQSADQGETASSDAPALDADYSSFDETAPALSGFRFQSEITPQNAALFRIFQYDQNVSLIEVQLRNDSQGAGTASAGKTDTDTEETSEAASAAETAAALFQNNIIKYLIVPDQTDLPAGTEKQAVVIRKPCDAVFLASEQVSALLQTWGLSSDFQTVEAGSYDAWDLKTLLQSKASLIIEDSRILSPENAETYQKNVNSSIQMNIPLFIDRSADENGETAQEEWKQVYQLIFS